MKQFYENSLPYLEAQAKYEKLLTEVEQARYQRATMQFQYANMMAANMPDSEEELDFLTNPYLFTNNFSNLLTSNLFNEILLVLVVGGFIKYVL